MSKIINFRAPASRVHDKNCLCIFINRTCVYNVNISMDERDQKGWAYFHWRRASLGTTLGREGNKSSFFFYIQL